MKHYKQLIAGAMAGVMVLGSSIVAFAADGGTTGQGNLDIAEQTDIFNVVLPVEPEDGSQFDYIVDPTGVIKVTEAEKYDGAKFEDDKTLYFKNTKPEDYDDQSGSNPFVDYKSTSDTLKVTNKSTMEVDITVNVSVAAVEGITLTNKTAVTEGTDAKLYLGFKDNKSKTDYVALTAEGLEATGKIAGAEDQYTVKYDSDSKKYTKALKDDADETAFKTYEFSLEGACSAKGWTSDMTPPAISAVWSIEDPTVTGPQIKLDGGAITVSGLDGTQFKSISINDGSSTTTLGSTHGKWTWTDDSADVDKVFTLSSSWTNYIKGKTITITITLKEGDPISKEFTVPA